MTILCNKKLLHSIVNLILQSVQTQQCVCMEVDKSKNLSLSYTDLGG